MVAAYLRRGVVAGLLAGLLAGLFGLAVGEPALDDAIALEEQGQAAEPAAGPAFSRPAQKAGLVAGTALVGLAVGALLGLASVWAAGRVQGDGWTRALKLGATVTAALVVFPALRYAPNPPGVGDPSSITTRTTLYLGAGAIGLLLAAAAFAGARQLARGRLSRPARQALVGAGVVLAAGALLAGLPGVNDPQATVPAELLWRFRLSSIGTQAVLWLGTAAGIGLLTARGERAA